MLRIQDLIFLNSDTFWIYNINRTKTSRLPYARQRYDTAKPGKFANDILLFLDDKVRNTLSAASITVIITN